MLFSSEAFKRPVSKFSVVFLDFGFLKPNPSTAVFWVLGWFPVHLLLFGTSSSQNKAITTYLPVFLLFDF